MYTSGMGDESQELSEEEAGAIARSALAAERARFTEAVRRYASYLAPLDLTIQFALMPKEQSNAARPEVRPPQ